MIRKLLQRWKSAQTKLVKESDWVTIIESTNEFQIRIDQLKLESEGIPVVIFDQRDSSYNAFGYLYLKVRAKDKDVAVKILNLNHE